MIDRDFPPGQYLTTDDKVGKLYDAMIGEPNRPGFFERVRKLESKATLVTWFAGISTIALVTDVISRLTK